MNYQKLALAVAMALGLSVPSLAQKSDNKGWHLGDSKTTSGISMDKAYEFVKGRKSKTVVVAVIDSGIDTTHEDLKPIMWVNADEKPGNGIDDDKNGYIDDVHGWNFLGGRDGRNVNEDSYEAARLYHQYKSKFENANPASLSAADKALYKDWQRAKVDVNKGGGDQNEVFFLKKLLPTLLKGDSVIQKEMGKKTYSGNDLKAYNTENTDAKAVKNLILQFCESNNSYDITNKDIVDGLKAEIRKADMGSEAPENFRGDIVKDNELDINDRSYGNNDLMAGTSMHGTHVSGIIGAKRGNGKGMDGVADNVRIMTLRAVPDGDEHDKDVALAIRYAVDNGAQVINMSFGKYYSPQKQWVDDAIKYAESKGVLIVAAAGNEAFLVDTMPHYPSPVFLDAKRARNWIMVGASASAKDGNLIANFSNFGKGEVDVFAPGVEIYSSVPGGNTYAKLSGTSMASPVTAGLAAFLMSYFPNLTAEEIKQAIEKSVQDPGTKVKVGDREVPFSEISRNPGIINAYEAAKIAEQLSKKKSGAKPKPAQIKKPAAAPVRAVKAA